MEAVGAISTGMQVFGTFLGAKGQLDAGKQQEQASQYQAAQLRQNALQEQAVGSQAAAEEIRKNTLIQSRILAVAGASGAGALDPTVVNLVSQTASEGKLAAATRVYNSDVAAQGLRAQADAAVYEGALAKQAGVLRAATTVLSGGKSMFDSYTMNKKLSGSGTGTSSRSASGLAFDSGAFNGYPS